MKAAIRKVPWEGLAAGLLAATAFAPWNLLPAAVFGVALLFRALRRRPEFGTGFLFGVGLLSPVMPWLAAFHILAPFGVILFSALPYGLAARAGATPGRFAASFTAAEFARSIGTFALPWGVLGTLAATTSWRGLAAWGGVWLLSFIIWLGGALLYRRPVVSLLFACAALGVAQFALPGDEGPRLRVAVVQGGFAMTDDYEFRPSEVENVLAAASRRAAEQGAELVVWSETVILEYLNLPGPAAERMQALADRLGVSLLVGAPSYVTGKDKRNSAYLIRPRLSGSIDATSLDTSAAAPIAISSPAFARFDKVHLVPFGEFLPGWGPDERHAILPEGTGDFSPAAHARPIRGVGPLICYEGALPNLARDQVLAGARLLANLANDAWTFSSVEAEQHYQLSLLRAVENGRPMVRAGNVGRSAVVEADGTVIESLAPGTRGVIVGELGLPVNRTFYTCFGDWVGWLTLVGTPFFLTVGGKRWDH